MRLYIKDDVQKKSNEMKKFLQMFENAIYNCLIVVANDLLNEIKYNKLAGNPIRRRTGNLQASIGIVKSKDKNSVEVGSFGVEYAKYLEYAEKFEKYRWLRTTYNEKKDDMQKIFNNEIEIQIKTKMKEIFQ